MSNKCAAYLSSGEQANLQYVGKVPGKAKFVGSSCFRNYKSIRVDPLTIQPFEMVGDFDIRFNMRMLSKNRTMVVTSSYNDNNLDRLSYIFIDYDSVNIIGPGNISFLNAPINTLEFNDIHIYRRGNVFTIKTPDKINSVTNDTFQIFYVDWLLGDFIKNRSGFAFDAEIIYLKIDDHVNPNNSLYFPFCEPIVDPSNHIYHDVSGNGNHATLINGTLANEGKQDKFHYLQRGLIKRDTGEIIPILEDESEFANGSLLDDVDAIQQDSKSFLNTGTELEAYDYPALKQADKDNNFWYIGDAGVRRVSHYELAIENLMSDKIFLDKTDKNI